MPGRRLHSVKIGNYALPLFALVNRHKVDLESRQLSELAEQLQGFLSANIGIAALDSRIEILARDPYLILNGVSEDSLPRLFALADAQRTQVFRYHRRSEAEATLTPLAVDPTAMDDE